MKTVGLCIGSVEVANQTTCILKSEVEGGAGQKWVTTCVQISERAVGVKCKVCPFQFCYDRLALFKLIKMLQPSELKK